MKLYQLETKGLGTYWVAADNAHEADRKLTKLLDDEDYGFSGQRLVLNTRLISEQTGDKPFVFSEEKRLII